VFRAGPEEAGETVDSYAIVTERFLVFVDTLSTPMLAQRLLRWAEPVMRERQTLVINTHADFDHSWGNIAFADLALLIGHADAVNYVNQPEYQDYFKKQQETDPRFRSVELVLPSLTFTDRLIIDGGDMTIEFHHTPGHTIDHCSVWMPAQRLLLAGDAAESPFPYIPRAGVIPQMRQSLQRLIDLDAAIILPSHGGTTDPHLLKRNIAYFDRLAERCRAAHDQLPETLDGREDLDIIIGFTYADALALAEVVGDVPAMYQDFHQAAIRATIEELRG
jgi:glyoxylase-like metal-dependent hydrolase (beta-lactamase superfamily II)